MARRKQLNARLLLSALAITAVLFGTGVFIGYSLNNQILQSVEENLRGVEDDVSSLQLQFLFFEAFGEEATCPLLTASLADINRDAYEIGARLTTTGGEDRIQDAADHERLEREYDRLLVSYWLLANKVKEACNVDADTIVYFFAKECVRCDDQGFILTYLKQKFGEEVLIFAMNADLAEPSVEVIKQYYQVHAYPALIINGVVYSGFLTQAELEEILDL